jgi:hypothetical protein
MLAETLNQPCRKRRPVLRLELLTGPKELLRDVRQH